MACVKKQSGASYRWLDRFRRLHAQHGPIDLVIQIEGDDAECRLAFEQAMTFFNTVLADLVAELPELRMPIVELTDKRMRGDVAKHMHQSVMPFNNEFVTPMAAVAGSVAEMTLAAMCYNRTLERACVNNGGDIALYLSAGSTYSVGICESTLSSDYNASAQINHLSPIRGVATSGWHGRSHSLGIADAVTVLASSAAVADTAATLIANRVDLPGSEKVQRVSATELSADSDLGERAVTVAVDTLTPEEKKQALSNGRYYANKFIADGLITSVYISLQGQHVVAGCHPGIHWKQTA